MGAQDPRVDAYIAGAAGFAKPILSRIRKVVHQGCPEVTETIKWKFPHFEYKGVLCSMAAFKSHCAFGFWKQALLAERLGLPAPSRAAMGQFGRITSLSDLPSEKTLLKYVKEAAALNEEGIRLPARPRRAMAPVKAPADMLGALRKNKRALAVFEGLSPSHRREYVEWVTEAKAQETRKRRLDTAVQWMSEGKVRNWRYIKE